MNRITRAAAALALAFSAAPALTSTASAADTAGTFTFQDGVLFDGCFDYEYEFFLDLPAGTTEWDLEVTVERPDGYEMASDYVFGTGRIGTLDSEVFMCGASDAGTLIATGTVEGYGDSIGSYELDMTPQTFTMRRPYSQTTAQALNTPKCGKVIKLGSTTLDERPNGFFPANYFTVGIQQYYNDAWRTIRGTDNTVFDSSTGNGITKIRWTPHKNGKCRPILLRVTTFQDNDYRDASYSEPLVIK